MLHAHHWTYITPTKRVERYIEEQKPSDSTCMSLQWRDNEHHDVSNHQPHDCLLNRLFRCRWKIKTKKQHQSSVPLAFVRGIHRWPVNSPHKWPVTRKMFPFDDVIMVYAIHKKWWATYLIKETHGLGALFGYIFIMFSLWFIYQKYSGLLHRFFSRC